MDSIVDFGLGGRSSNPCSSIFLFFLKTFKFGGVWHFMEGSCKYLIFWNGVFLMKWSLVIRQRWRLNNSVKSVETFQICSSKRPNLTKGLLDQLWQCLKICHIPCVSTFPCLKDSKKIQSLAEILTSEYLKEGAIFTYNKSIFCQGMSTHWMLGSSKWNRFSPKSSQS